MSPRLTALKMLLWFVCLMHLSVGISLTFSTSFQIYAASLYHSQVDWTPQIIYLVRTLGSFIAVLGLLAIPAARNPARHTVIIYGFVTLFLFRNIIRLVFHQELTAGFAVPAYVNITTFGFFLILALALLGLTLSIHHSTDTT